MTARKRIWFFVEGDDQPHGGWQRVVDVDDPTFDVVAARMEENPDPPVDLWRGLSKLTQKQRFVVELRFGLSGKGEYTEEETARVMGISQQAVSLLYHRALKSLQRGCRASL